MLEQIRVCMAEQPRPGRYRSIAGCRVAVPPESTPTADAVAPRTPTTADRSCAICAPPKPCRRSRPPEPPPRSPTMPPRVAPPRVHDFGSPNYYIRNSKNESTPSFLPLTGSSGSPDSVGLARVDGVAAARLAHRTLMAYLFCASLPDQPRVATFMIRRVEDLRGHAPAQRFLVPCDEYLHGVIPVAAQCYWPGATR